MRYNKPRTVALILLVVSIITLSIAFAMLSNKLTISGNAKLDPINWSIYFDNISGVDLSGEAAIVDNPEIDSNDKTKITNFNVTLNKPGDKATFTVDLVNESDITAIISGIDTPTINYDFIEFKAIYTGTNTEVALGNVIEARKDGEASRVNITISVYYSKEKVTNEDLAGIPAGGLTISLKNYGLTFEQSDELANMPTTTKWINGCTTDYVKKASNETYEIGELISFCNENARYTNSDGVYVKGKSEDFYVISDNGDTVSALASYNLMVGSKATDKYAIAFPGLQAKGITAYPVAFADKDGNNMLTNCDGDGCYLGYWANMDGSLNDSYKNENQTDYPADVYKEEENKSLLREPLKNYEAYFTSTINKTTAKMRLITYNELVGLGCDSSSKTCKTETVTTNKRDWIYNTSYWSASARDCYYVWLVIASGTFEGYPFWYDAAFGVRPVITISKSDI